MRTLFLAVGVAALALASACGGQCKALPSQAPEGLCAERDGGLTAKVFSSTGTWTCDVARDGGDVVLTLSGADCTPASTAPVVFIDDAKCDLSKLSPGTYTTRVGGMPTTLTVPLTTDAGIAACP